MRTIELNDLELEKLKDFLESLRDQQVVRMDYDDFDKCLDGILKKLKD